MTKNSHDFFCFFSFHKQYVLEVKLKVDAAKIQLFHEYAKNLIGFFYFCEKMAQLTITLSHEQVQQLISGQDLVIHLTSGAYSAAQTLLPKADGRVPTSQPKTTFFQFFREQISIQMRNGCQRTAETYKVAYHKFLGFCNQEEISFEQFDAILLEGFQKFLRHQDLSLNTISFYMRILRAVNYKAIEQGLTIDRQPFCHVYTGQAKTEKRAIGIEDIRKIKSLSIDDERIRLARDLFLFSFYTRGMSFVDIAYLQPENIRNGVLSYKRRKTGQMLSIRWEGVMQEIVNQYRPACCREYLLPVIKKVNGKERNQYRHVQALVNKHLKEVAKMAGMNQTLTMYCARHSWASIARQLQIPMEIISHGMGHAHERTTEIYLKSIDSQSIDQANLRIVNLLQEV